MNRDGKENPASIRCLTMLLRCLQDSSTVPLRLMPAALRFTPIELRMLKNTHDAVTIRYGAPTVQAGSATTASRSPTNVHDLAVFMWQVIRDVSNTTIHPDSCRTLKNGHDSTHGAAKNEPDPATVALRFRPRPQSTTIHPECFKRFKIVVALPGRFSNRQESSRYYYGSCRCLYGATTNHADAPRFDKSGWTVALPGPKPWMCDWGLR